MTSPQSAMRGLARPAFAAAVLALSPGLAETQDGTVSDWEERGLRALNQPNLFEGAWASLLPLAPTRVRRTLEILRIEREPNGWKVEEIDVFESGPAPETVTMGLPEFEGMGEEADVVSPLRDVRFYVDGVEVGAELQPPPTTGELGAPAGIGRLHTWTLRFAPGEKRVTRLVYRVSSSRTRQGDELFFFYLNTGTPWAGPSGRINVRIELGDRSSDELVLGWLRPENVGLTPTAAVWRLDEEEPVSDLVLALRPFQDPLEPYADRGRGILAEPDGEWGPRLDASTHRELRFWRAFLEARRGDAVDPEFSGYFAAESWYVPRVDGTAPRAWTEAENELFTLVTDRLRQWEPHRFEEPLSDDPSEQAAGP